MCTNLVNKADCNCFLEQESPGGDGRNVIMWYLLPFFKIYNSHIRYVSNLVKGSQTQ